MTGLEGFPLCWRHVHVPDMYLGSRLNTLGHLIYKIGRLMNPATLLCRFWKFTPQGRPESQAAVPDRQLWTLFEPPVLESAQRLLPGLFAPYSHRE